MLSKTQRQSDGKPSRHSSALSPMSMYRALAILLSAAAVAAFARLGPGALTSADLRSSLGVLVGASASLLGFLVSAGALLYAVSNTTLARNLQRTGHFQSLLGDLFSCAGAFFGALLISGTCLFIPTQDTAAPLALGFSVLEIGLGAVIFTQFLAYLLLIPVGNKMWLLLSNIQPERPGRLE